MEVRSKYYIFRNSRERSAALPASFPGGKNKQVKPAGLRCGPLDDDEVVLSGNESQTTPRSVDLIHAVDEFHDTLPAHIGVVVGVVQFGDSDGVANLDTMR